ncbi:unnamed protein product [Angiostrongylus costaricensis]|uniref:Uncharacterized protein n=1 Tax=Angiostrongylus costaricensis TaxID=334426 RepID=A0A0R3PUV0_ANGCS|nr:unnamed protein product [Angiostrongylus costaricensis]
MQECIGVDSHLQFLSRTLVQPKGVIKWMTSTWEFGSASNKQATFALKGPDKLIIVVEKRLQNLWEQSHTRTTCPPLTEPFERTSEMCPVDTVLGKKNSIQLGAEREKNGFIDILKEI